MLLKQFYLILLSSALSWALDIESLGTSKDEMDLDSAKTIFDVYVKEFNKLYQSGEEHQKRFVSFVENIIFINKRNIEAGSKTYGLTSFTDISWEEFKATHMCIMEDKMDVSKVDNYTSLVKEYGLGEGAPDSLDWVGQGAVTGVKNQGLNCSTCWAFSSTGTIEGQYFIRNKQLKSFSEQELLDCITDSCSAPYAVLDALNKIPSLGGLMTEQDYPYDANPGACRLDKNKIVVKVQSGSRTSMDETQLMEYLSTYGPISITIKVEQGFQHYQQGVYNPDSCEGKYHAILLVGYGMDSGTPYWKVKNSWGTTWGESGFGRVIRGKNVCGIATFLTTVTLA